MIKKMYILKIILMLVGILILGIIIYLISNKDNEEILPQSEIEYINSLKQLPTMKKLILFIKKSHISEVEFVLETGYYAIIQYKFDKALRRKQPQYKITTFDVIIYKNNKQIIEHDAIYYQNLYLSTDGVISDIDAFVRSSINSIYKECMEYKSSLFTL
jgi:hypothetical protein